MIGAYIDTVAHVVLITVLTAVFALGCLRLRGAVGSGRRVGLRDHSSRTPGQFTMAMNGVEQTLVARARCLALKSPVCAIKLTPGCNQVKTLRGQRTQWPTSLRVLRTFCKIRVRQCSRTGTVTRSVGHANTMVRVRLTRALRMPWWAANYVLTPKSCVGQCQSRKKREAVPKAVVVVRGRSSAFVSHDKNSTL
jgi:hypothetical protein